MTAMQKTFLFLKKKYFFNSSEDVFLGSGYTFMLEEKNKQGLYTTQKNGEKKITQG